MSRVREACNDILMKLGVDNLSWEERNRTALMTDDDSLVYTMGKMMERIDELDKQIKQNKEKLGYLG